MQVHSDKLRAQLGRQLAPCYLLAGEEPLILQEAADLIRATARSNGCVERHRISIENKDDWMQLLQASDSLSLFAERKLIEVHLPSGKPGAEGSKAILDYLAIESDDVLLLMSGKIDKSSQRSKWFNALDQKGVVSLIWPVKPMEMPRWIAQRLQDNGMHAEREAVQLLAERMEGNLLAAAQEIEKLRLLVGQGDITADMISHAVLDSARFDPFNLVDTALAGNVRHSLRTIRGLRGEGSAPQVILWALHREIRQLAKLRHTIDSGSSFDQAARQSGLWRARIPLFRSALQRHNLQTLQQLEVMALQADGAGKGFIHGDPWRHLDNILILLARGAAATAAH